MTDRPTAQRAPATASPSPAPAGPDAAETGLGAPKTGPVFTTSAVVASCFGFVLIGALQALYGPSIPALREEFGLSPSAAGLGLSAHFAGGVVGVLLFDRRFGRTGNRRILAVAYLLMAAGAAGFALAPDWPFAILAALLAGIGFGGIDYGLNRLFATGFGRRSTAMLNILNAHFGVGAILGPAVIGAVGSEHYPALFLAFALANLPLLFCLRGVKDHTPQPAFADTGAAATASAATASADSVSPDTGGTTPVGAALRSVLAVFVTLYVLHVGIEAGVGGWEPTHLESVGYGAGAAATATSVYWLMMTLGRFLAAPVALRFSAQAIITVSCAGMTACLLLAAIPDVAPYAYAGVGLFIAPIFPTGLPWLSRVAPGARRAGAIVMAASMLGGVAAGPALGKIIEWSGVRAVPLILAAVSAACLAATLWLTRTTSRPSP
ncbi:FHS family glucose/mannose:H+ symporter-like MFS transporter [Streptomyces achromogenes]|uniref:FHS family glucose/mannose:H+ symporter-like MFS transporter n=1 Tax=Streptomyces achromogenes TaxID=67255 RepID=A0ABU0Q6G1_STRAH|nr:MFS transporter [Streptomyces achromogenes]MDQ0686254.1 FHS family glucose/mannose:H+ symporter-like MFS transporter [Streptomyces achromogenes]